MASSAGAVERADVALAEKLGQHRRDPAVREAGSLSEIADQAPAMAACAAVLAAGLVSGRLRVAEAGSRMLASVLLATALKSVVKRLVSRTRPHVLLDEGRYELQMGRPQGRDHNSFPSGHTADAFAAARGLARAFPDAAGPAYAVATAIALVQVPRAKHYPLDVAAGAVIGIASEALVHQAASRLVRFSSPGTSADASPRRPPPPPGGRP